MSRAAACVVWTVAVFFLAVCVGDTFTGTPAAWGLLGWTIPPLAVMGIVLWREP